ncbi:hypothetical protein CBR59_22300 [Bacillus thuringiensis]|nr:hypothetical protein CBP87_24155 [Bacillus thuringiensis]PNK52725.1 hypothetical protein CBR59_22300 [Bacillus thuringiensis]
MPLCFCSILFTSLFNSSYITDFTKPTIPQFISLFITTHEPRIFHEWIIAWRNIIYLYKKYKADVKP